MLYPYTLQWMSGNGHAGVGIRTYTHICCFWELQFSSERSTVFSVHQMMANSSSYPSAPLECDCLAFPQRTDVSFLTSLIPLHCGASIEGPHLCTQLSCLTSSFQQSYGSANHSISHSLCHDSSEKAVGATLYDAVVRCWAERWSN